MDTTENQEGTGAGDNLENNNLEEFAPKQGKSKLPIVIGIAVVLGIVLLFYFIQNQNLKKEVESTQGELNQAVLQLDSIGGELDTKILELTKLGADVEDLLVVKAELEEEKKKLLTTNRANRNTIVALKDKVSGYEELLVLKDKEITQLKEENDVLMTENTTLKTEKNQLSDSISSINQTAEQLTAQVAIASRLKMTGMKIFSVSEKGREREAEFRNRHIDNIRIHFSVEENAVAPIEGKELLVRVVGPDGNVLFDVTSGSGSFNFEGREMFYTAKKEILYDRSTQEVSILYNKGSEYDLGRHGVEVYTDDYLMGKGSFVVK